MLSFPNAKINLGLYITARRSDGYHDLETVFYPVPGMKDALEIVPAKDKGDFRISGRSVAGETSNNLVAKALRLLQQEHPGKLDAPIDIYLHKAIPMGAGMGGGSANGAFMLRMLNDYFELGLTKEQLCAYALQLGSDCPFFIYNTPQFAGGRGEQMQAIPLDLSRYSIQLVCPEIHVSTAQAFAGITPKAATYDLRDLHQSAPEQWKDKVSNDFEATIFPQFPQLAAIKEQLYAGGACYASMSGSGSTVYGIFKKGMRADIRVPGDIPAEIHYCL